MDFQKVKMSLFKNKTLVGFSIIEAIVATSIIVTVSVVPIYMGFNLFYNNRTIKDKIIATGIAYEGVELILNYRDSWRNYCQIGGTNCDLESKGLNNMKNKLHTDCLFADHKCSISEENFIFSKKAFDEDRVYNPSNNVDLTKKFSRIMWFDEVINNSDNYSQNGNSSNYQHYIKLNVLVCINPESLNPSELYPYYCRIPYSPKTIALSDGRNYTLFQPNFTNISDWSNFVYLTTYIYK